MSTDVSWAVFLLSATLGCIIGDAKRMPVTGATIGVIVGVILLHR